MSTFEERIAKAVTDKLNDGTVEELVSDAVTKALKSSIEDQFNWKGEAKKIIDEKVKEVMTPVIERVNLDKYTVKDDSSLSVSDIAINCGFVKLCCQTVKAFVLKCLRSGSGC